MNFLNLATEKIGRTGALVMLAIAGTFSGTFYVLYTFYVHTSEFKENINSKLGKQEILLKVLPGAINVRLWDVELMALNNRKKYVLAMPESEERAELLSVLDKNIRYIEELQREIKYDLTYINRE